MNESQFQQLLTAMMEGIKPVRSQVNFSRNPGEVSIVEWIEYSSETVIKLLQEAT